MPPLASLISVTSPLFSPSRNLPNLATGQAAPYPDAATPLRPLEHCSYPRRPPPPLRRCPGNSFGEATGYIHAGFSCLRHASEHIWCCLCSVHGIKEFLTR